MKKESENSVLKSTEILVVEDSITQVTQIKHLLESHHYKVIVAHDGEEAIRKLSKHKPSLVISDIVMPEMNGYELCKKIKSNKNTEDIPVILLTILADSAEIIEGLSCGADSFITKPYNEEFLLSHIEKLLTEEDSTEHKKVPFGVQILYKGEKRLIQAEQQNVIMLMLDIYEAAIHQNEMLIQTQEELRSLNERLESIVEERTSDLSEEIKLSNQITKSLKESEERWRTLVTTIPEYIGLVDCEGKFLFLNHYAEGFSEKDTIGKSNLNFIPTKWKEFYRLNFERCISTQKNQIFEYTAFGDNKTLRTYETCLIPIIQQGKVLSVMAIARDITERNQAEEKLRNSEERLKILFDYAPDAYYLNDLKGNFIDGNIAAEKLLGHDRNELIGKSFLKLNLLSLKQLPTAAKLLVKNSLGQPTGPDEFVLSRKDGSEVTVEIITHPVKIKDKTLVLGLARDITERKRAQTELERTLLQQAGVNLLQQSLLTSASLTQKLKSITERIVRIFDADFCRIWLIQPGDLCEKGCPHALVLEGPHVCRYHDLCLHLKSSSGRYTHTDGIVHRRVPFGCYKIGQIASGDKHKFITNDAQNDPRVHNLEWTRELGLVSFVGYQIRAPGSPAIGVLALFAKHEISPSEDMILDGISSSIGLIVQQTLAEEALRESEEKYRLLIDTANESIIVVQDGLLRFFNNITIELLEMSSEQELIGRPFPEFIHPDDRKMVVENYRRRIANEGAQQRYAFRVVTFKGIVKWVEINAVLIEWQGKPATLNFLSDITERKRADEVLKESEDKYRRIFENVQDMFYETSIEGIMLEVSPSVELISKGQYKRDDVIGKSMYDFFYDPMEGEILMNILRERGFVSDFEIILKNRDGSKIPCSVSSKIIFDVDGRPKEIIGSMRDITDRKFVEEELKKNQSQLINAHIIAHLGSWEYNVEKDIFTFNDPFYAIFRTTAEQVGGYTMKSADYAKRFVHPDDMALVGSQTRKAIETDDPNFSRQLEHRVIYADGEKGYVTVRFLIEKNKKGKTVRTFGVNQDITEQKRNEESLRHSELRFKQLSENSGEWIWEIDKNGLYTYSSPVVKEMLGYEPEEIINKKHFYDFFNPALREQLKQAIFDMFTRKESFKNFLNSNLHKEGGEVILSTSGIPIFDNEGNYIGYRGVDRDITESKNAEEALRKSEEKFRSIMENSADAIFITDQQGKYQYVNKAATDMLGFTLKEMQSKTIIDLTSPGKKDEYFEIFKKVLTEGKIFAEIELLRKDGGFISTDLNSVLLPGGLVYGSCRDITEKKLVQMELKKYRDHLEELVIERTEELGKAKKEAEEANKAKSEFLANMSHEIRTPMNAVLGYSELLSNLITDETAKNYLDSIKTSGRGLLSLINDILDLSKIEAGKLEFEFEFVDSHSFFSEIQKIFSFSLSEKKLEYMLEISSSTPMGLCIDEIRVRQIVVNLVGNAIKFTKKGHIKLSVWTENPHILKITDTRNEEYIDLFIEVEDTGIGISKEMQKIIFEAFQQESRRKTQKFGGTGLGLNISRRLAELLNGTISVESVLNKGSKFRVMIPDVNYIRDFKETDNDLNFDTSRIVFEPAVLLVADDSKINRNLIKDVLRNSSIKIVEAENGKQAYDLAKKIIPNLIIADIRMPVVDGFELAQLIKNDPVLYDIPLIAYSASVMKSQKEKILKGNFVGLLSKPIRIQELLIELANNLPHQILQADQSPEKDHSDNDFSNLIMEDIRFIINQLDKQLMEKWKNFTNNQPKDLVREFGNNIKDLGDKFHINMFTKYGNDLVVAIDSFDIESMLRLINQYPKLTETFKDIANKANK